MEIPVPVGTAEYAEELSVGSSSDNGLVYHMVAVDGGRALCATGDFEDIFRSAGEYRKHSFLLEMQGKADGIYRFTTDANLSVRNFEDVTDSALKVYSKGSDDPVVKDVMRGAYRGYETIEFETPGGTRKAICDGEHIYFKIRQDDGFRVVRVGFPTRGDARSAISGFAYRRFKSGGSRASSY